MPTDPFTFSARGNPRPLPRPRFVKGRAVSITGAKVKLWRSIVQRAIREAIAARGDPLPIFTGAVRMTCVFTIKPAAGKEDRHGMPHTHKPDASNLLKLVEDVAEAEKLFRNDSQVAQGPPEKWWGADPGVTVLIEPIDGVRREQGATALKQAPAWLAP